MANAPESMRRAAIIARPDHDTTGTDDKTGSDRKTRDVISTHMTEAKATTVRPATGWEDR